MRHTIWSAVVLTIVVTSLSAQNITNTLGTEGVFSVKYGATLYLGLSASNGTLELTRNLYLLPTTAANVGVIVKSGNRFLHDFQATGTTGENTFLGVNAGNFTMSGASNQASENTGVGFACLGSLTTGFYNSAFGHQSMPSATTAYDNAAFGDYALYSLVAGTGNSAFGMNTLRSVNADGNSAFGYGALQTDTSGGYNTAIGEDALFYNQSGNYNTALGYGAGLGNTTGSNNICIGYNAVVPSNTASNQVQIGNTNVTYAGVQVAWTTSSDRRLKTEIVPTELGMNFISRLQPVSYVRKNDKNRKTEYGFIAQDVENTLRELRAKNPGMITIDNKGTYELRYNDLLAPMVKAIQELKAENEALTKRLETLEHIQHTSTKESKSNTRNDQQVTTSGE